MESTITNLVEVKRFISDCYIEHHLIFHPDTLGEDYYNRENGQRTFTDSEAAQFNADLDKCFEICKERNLDIYQVTLDVVHLISSKLK